MFYRSKIEVKILKFLYFSSEILLLFSWCSQVIQIIKEKNQAKNLFF